MMLVVDGSKGKLSYRNGIELDGYDMYAPADMFEMTLALHSGGSSMLDPNFPQCICIRLSV